MNILDGVTSTAAELNILDGVTATTAELNYVVGVTSSIQTQISGKISGITVQEEGSALSTSATTLNFEGSAVTATGSGTTKTITITGGDVVTDTTPQLGGNLDVNGKDIVSASNGDIELDPNGSGNVIIKGNATRGSGQIKLNCENNSHGITIKGPPHSAAADYTLTLPNNDGDADQVLKTDGSGVLSWVAQSGGGGGGSSKWTDVGSGNIYRNSDVHIGGTTDPTVELQVTGSITATSDITAFSTSDSRLKENLQILENPLEAIAQISGYRFDWKGGFSEIHKNEGSDVGVIAHEVEAVLPEVVKDRDDGYKGVRYDKMVPLLIECIKELKKEVEELKRGRL